MHVLDLEVLGWDEKWEIQDRFEVKTFFFREHRDFGEKSERRDQSSFSFLENINFWKSLRRAPEFEYPPLII